jgi:hypothetical protein
MNLVREFGMAIGIFLWRGTLSSAETFGEFFGQLLERRT